MRVYISSSGNLAGRVAELLRDWLPQVLQPVEPWLAIDAVQAGQIISEKMREAISESDAALLCITRADLESAWLNWEAGYFAASTQNPVIPVLVDLAPRELVGPISQFQAAGLRRQDMLGLVGRLNELLPEPMSSASLQASFDGFWPRLHERLDALQEKLSGNLQSGARGAPQGDQAPSVEAQPLTSGHSETDKPTGSTLTAIMASLVRLEEQMADLREEFTRTPSSMEPPVSEGDAVGSGRPQVFIGSTVEGLAVAEAIQLELDHVADCTIWGQGVFAPGSTAIEDLVLASTSFGWAIIIMTADDLVLKRGDEQVAPRDNLIFELGLFTGSRGRARTFMAVPRGVAMHMPTDLAGVTRVDYNPLRADGNTQAAVGALCTRIKQAMGRSAGVQ